MRSFCKYLLLCMLLATSFAYGASFIPGPDGHGVIINGEIMAGDAKKFSDFLVGRAKIGRPIDHDTVYLNSPGGDVAAALALADIFNRHLSATMLESGAECYSACTIIFASGSTRFLSRFAKLGFHRLSLARNEIDVKNVKESLANGNQKVTDFFRSVGFPNVLIDRMVETAPSDLFIVDLDWLIDHDLMFAMEYQPAFLDVAERQCGLESSAAAVKASRKMTAEESASLKTWMGCADRVKEVNRKIRVDEFLKQLPAAKAIKPPSTISGPKTTEAQREEVVDKAFPNWRADTKSTNFLRWFKTQTMDIKILAGSEDPADAIRLLRIYYGKFPPKPGIP